MITFVFGRAGSGKSVFIENKIKEDIVAGREVWLIVPEQQTYTAERHYTKILPPSSQLSFEVVNFSRLANKAFRLYGGLSYNYIDNGMKSLLMWRTLRDLAPLLEEYGSAAGDSRQLGKLTPMMISITNELKVASATPQFIEKAASKLNSEDHLRAKLRDIALICASYNGAVSEKYDDAADDLSKLSELLVTHNFFADKHIYIDSFTSYTAEEYKIIDRIFATAASTTVTVGCDSPDSKEIHMLSLKEAADKLRRMADRRGKVENIFLDGTKRFTSNELAILEKHIWNMEFSALPELETSSSSGAVELVKCKDPYSEAEAAAVRICEELRVGMRCRDIAVIVRDAKKWSGIVDAVFDKFDIPYFISERTDISSKPLFKLLISALRIKNRAWQQNDVISLIKTGLCGICDREADIFENYCTTWNINGKTFIGDDWSMNPDGYTSIISERGREMLLVANDVKKRITEPLVILFTELDAASNTREMCRALYEYTERMGLRTSLASLAEKELSSGNRREYDETLRLYSVYTDALEKLAEALSDERPDCEEFASALQALLDNTDIGSLPTRQDEVTIGSASMLRADAPRLVIVMGLNEGEFPADVSDSGILSAADRIALSELGIELSADRAVRSSEELFYVYRAISAPSEKLMLTCSETTASGSRREPSVPFLRTAKILNIKQRDYDSASVTDRIQTPEIALEYLKSLGDTPEADVLRSSLSKLDGIKEAMTSLEIPLSDSDCMISPDTARELFGDKLSISQSRLETYSRCHFNYFCDYVLGLREDKRAEFAANQTGDFIHYIMERFMRESLRDGKFNCNFSDNDALALARSIISDYASRIIPDSDERAERLSYLFSRLERIALMMIINIRREFSHSLFSPSFFELKIDGTDPIFPNAASVDTGNGTEVSLKGIVDRVDLFRRGKDVYIRVIDYKTGSREYSPSDVADGLGLQLLLYLFSLCKSNSPEFRDALNCPPDGNIYPAGALYLSANMPVISVDGDISEDEIRREAEKAIKRSGPLLSDDEILEAMNDEFDPSYLGGVKKTKDGVTKGKNLLSSEGFDSLYDSINATISTITDEMRSGAASADPKIKQGNSPCDWCVYSAVCRSARTSERH